MEILGDMMIPTQSINASNDSDSSSEDEDYVDHEEDDEDDKLEQQAQAVVAQQRHRKEENSYLKKPFILEQLPQENDPNYPQENKAYLAKKHYLCLDKHELSDFIFEDVPMPTIRDSYKYIYNYIYKLH